MTHVGNERLSKIVADRLQEHIIKSGLDKGTALPTEPEIMKEYGVSRTVVREAAALLVSRGLVEVRPRRGMTVRAPDGFGVAESLMAQLRMSKVTLPQLLQVRLTLECAIARYAAQERADMDLVRLRDNLDSMLKLRGDRALTIELDIAFHELLAAATYNLFFSIVSRPINELLRKLYIEQVNYMSNIELTYKEHTAIVDAIEKRDSDAADRATRQHLDRVGKFVANLVTELNASRQSAAAL